MKKYFLLVLIFASMLFLCGYRKKDVELMRGDSKLIDLDKAIGIAKPGANSSEKAESETDETEDSSDENIDENTNTDANDANDSNDKLVNISIEGKTISVGRDVYKDIQEFEKSISKDAVNGQTYNVVDRYADSRIYKGVLALLKKIEEEKDIKVYESEPEY